MTGIPSVASNPPPRCGDPVAGHRKLIVLLCAGVLLLGSLQAWHRRHFIDADAVSYMDIAKAVSHGQWAELVNGYWSPLYPATVGLVLRLADASPRWSATIAHAVNVGVFILVLACFHFFWAGVIRWQHEEHGRQNPPAVGQGDAPAPLPAWAWLVVGYGVFAWASINLIGLSRAAPDLWVSGFMYLAMGLLVRLRRGRTGYGTFVALGIALGLGYLTKTIMFVLAFVFLFTALSLAGGLRRGLPRVLVALAVFLAIGSPFIIALSLEKGRLTCGDVGRIGYALYVTGYHPDYVAHDEEGDNPLFDWQGGLPLLGTPVHPKRVLHDRPRINELAGPVGGSYPFWYDPSYWYEGIEARFHLTGQIVVLKDSARALFDLLYRRHGIVIASFLIVAGAGRPWRRCFAALVRHWWLWLVPLAGIGSFSLILVLPRYVAPFFVILWAAGLSAIRLKLTIEGRCLVRAATTVAMLGLAVALWPTIAPAADRAFRDTRWRMDTEPNLAWEVASGLREMGIAPGDHVGHIGKALKSWSYWASVADVRIVAELRPADAFWSADAAERARLLDVFRTKTDAVAVVSRRPLTEALESEGWQPIRLTGFCVYRLRDRK